MEPDFLWGIHDEIFYVTYHHCIYKLNKIFFEKDNVKYPFVIELKHIRI